MQDECTSDCCKSVTPAKESASDIHAGRRIEYISLAWTSFEALAAVAAGVLAGSIALIGFGADSVIEIGSSAILLWRLNHEFGEERERIALRLVGVSFLLLAVYVGWEAVESLVKHQPPGVSYFGIVFSILCLIVMPLLARAKRRIAARLDSRAMEADSKQSSICGYLAAILLCGLALNALFGWWWADPVAALVMLPIIIKEGVEGLRGETCGCH
ncbi:MAG TPA: cation transporter [Candidatus Limnocylindrales bacterium]|nr:cation transporter [Candidatus Limnocylindrales bacterium]